MLRTHALAKAKATVLATMVAGGTLFASCGWTDVRHNLVAGTQNFVKGYTTDLWEALIPPAADLVNFGGD